MRKKYFGNLDLKNFTDNKKFWNTVKPFFSKSSGGSRKITLVENDEVISDDQEVANTFNNFFDEAVSVKEMIFILYIPSIFSGVCIILTAIMKNMIMCHITVIVVCELLG